ncbi:hypothetical protein JM18_006487 [Phytophthora kernoviae]|uniref:Calcineurin-like phosphoesterase domain-containing protein n=1 Tax=Phytophthora kernoviae TaxID=325452 RepID=A0A921V5U6_9STRA|nr:hypothetical protein JM18_006487 [Phytophthora kernoviae]
MPHVPIPESPVTRGDFQALDSTESGPSKRFQALRAISNRRKFFIALIVVLALVAVITLSIVLTQSDESSEDSGDSDDDVSSTTNSLILPYVAVGNLSLVGAKTEDNSKDQCLDLGWIPTGVDWVASSGGTIYYLCMQQSVEATDEEDVGSVDLNKVSVLRRLVIVTDEESCPTNMQTLTNPSTNTFVCLESTSANKSFNSQQYVVDVMTTTEAFYSHDTPGWITWPTDLKFDSDASSVFMSVRYPVRPIVGLEVLTDVATNSIYSACDELEPVGEWETPGFVLKSSEAASSSAGPSDVLVCVQRPQVDANDSLVVLLDITVVLATETCPEAADNVTNTEITSDQIKLCAEWGTVQFGGGRNSSIASALSEALTSFVAELALYETTDNEAGDVNISSTIPGDWQIVGNESTGTLHTFFLARKFEPFVLNSTLADASSTGSGNDSVTSSVEAVVVSNNSDGANQTQLSFRVLQIADLHLTGDPDYACSSAPTGPYRASILEAAAVIAREIKGIGSSSSNLEDDPLYNDCREALTVAFLDELLDIEQPDFVIFSGDNVHTSDATNHTLAIGIFTGRVESRGIPWAAVFGNHDTEGGFSREDMLELMVEGQQYSHVKYGPRDIGGVGNYEVNVVAPFDGPWGEQGSTVFRMYFLDSHADIDAQTYPLITNSASYDWIKEAQIDFYRELASSHATEQVNGDNSLARNGTDGSIPAVMYFHIPLPEYALASPSNQAGDKNEATASAEVNCGLFSALVEMGDVKATFVGHDHINEYCYLRQGIQLCYGGGIGMGRAYGFDGHELQPYTNTTLPPDIPESASPIIQGACYSPFHNAEYPLNGGSNAAGLDTAMDNDFSIMKNYVTIARTYYSTFYGYPVTPHAAKYGMTLYLGVYMTDESWYDSQVSAAVAAVKDYPDTIAAILVGNENIAPAGPYSAAQVSSRITALRSRILAETGRTVKIGTVQRLTEWVDTSIQSAMLALADNCDIVGVNIYPFFDASYTASDPLVMLNGAWNKMLDLYSVDKLRLTEIGYPTAGAPPSFAPNNIPSLANSIAFYTAFLKWSPASGGQEAFWFMFFDRRPDDNTMVVDLEKYFGFFTYQKVPKASNFPISVAASTSAPTPAPVAATSAPTTAPAATTTPTPTSSSVCRIRKVYK